MLLLRANVRFEKVSVMKKLFAALILLVSFLFASQPHRLNFQGVLTDAHGKSVIDTTYTVGFGIYDAEIAGNKLWEESKLLNTVNGVYQTTLGNDSTLNALAFDQTYYVAISVNNTALPQRTKLTPVPYAISSNRVTGEVAATASIANGLVVKSLHGLQDNVIFQVEGSLQLTVDPIENKIILNGLAPDQGEQGPIGVQGPAGPTGVEGPAGIKGEAGHGLKIDRICSVDDRANQSVIDGYPDYTTCIDTADGGIHLFRKTNSSFVTLGIGTVQPETNTQWNTAYTHSLNSDLHFSTPEAKVVAERPASTTQSGYLSDGDYRGFREADSLNHDSINILETQVVSIEQEVSVINDTLSAAMDSTESQHASISAINIGILSITDTLNAAMDSIEIHHASITAINSDLDKMKDTLRTDVIIGNLNGNFEIHLGN